MADQVATVLARGAGRALRRRRKVGGHSSATSGLVHGLLLDSWLTGPMSLEAFLDTIISVDGFVIFLLHGVLASVLVCFDVQSGTCWPLTLAILTRMSLDSFAGRFFFPLKEVFSFCAFCEGGGSVKETPQFTHSLWRRQHRASTSVCVMCLIFLPLWCAPFSTDTIGKSQ